MKSSATPSWRNEFLSIVLARRFDEEKEMRRPESFASLVDLYRTTHDEQLAFVTNLTQTEIERKIDLLFLQGQSTIAKELTDSITHSQNHRDHCPSRLHQIGAAPPDLDYALWAKERPTPAWPQTLN